MRSVTVGKRGPGRWWAAFEGWLAEKTRPTLVRWEALPGQAQFMVTLPVAVVLLFFLHVIAFHLSPFRSFFYALFWGIPFALIVVAASRNESLKRGRGRDGNRPPE
ncbi:MAG TPA: hypothetical protein VHS27_05190 [Gaiellales bacterium]|nr:hypothetical protein [Gaiellales bacterium]